MRSHLHAFIRLWVMASSTKTVLWTFKVFVFVFFVDVLRVHCESHFLQYIYTVTSGVNSSSPVFSAVGVCDDRQISHCCNERQEWIRDDLTGDDWRNGPGEPDESRDRHLNLLNTLTNCRECPELHTLQRRIGCEVKTSSSGKEEIQAFDDYGFDGEDFISFDFKMMTWTNKSPKAEEIRMKWDSNTYHNEYLWSYLTNCVNWISTYNSTNSPPEIHMFAMESPHDHSKLNLICLATGFYPKHIKLEMRQNDIKLESLKSTGVRPNNNNTFQLRATVEINRGEKEGFECIITHSSLTQPVITQWDGNCTNCPKVPTEHVAVITLAFVVFGILCTWIFRKPTNGQRNSNEGQNQNSGVTKNSMLPIPLHEKN